MQYQVFVQNESGQHFVASVLGIPNLTVVGKTEEEAISNVKSAGEMAPIVNLSYSPLSVQTLRFKSVSTVTLW